MPSPFPGMDPWLEDDETFPDLHEKLLVYLGDALNAVLPPGYRARARTRVWVDDEARREPDVSVLGRVYLARHDGPFTFPDGEVVASERIPLAELEGWISRHELCPDSLALAVGAFGALGATGEPGPGQR